MKGNVTPLLDVIEGKNKILEIPVYQRNYDWKRENIAKLFQDLVGVAQNDKQTHFFGSLVTRTEDGHQVIVIDGQQRITSVTLLLVALRQRYLEEGNQSRAEEIYETYLYNKFTEANDHLKLRPIERDRIHYKLLFMAPENYARPSNITTNFEFFTNAMAEMSITNDQLFEAIGKLEVMQLSLQVDDDPQLIFESINSTGLDLTDADKVRNLLLMNESSEQQNKFFNAYWHPIEEKSQYDVTPLIRYWLTNQLNRVTNNKRLYFDFKDYITRYADKEELLKELLMYANNYERIMTAKVGDESADQMLERDENLAINAQLPFYLAILASVHRGKLTMKDFSDAVAIVETYLFRRAIVEAPTNALSKLFATLHRDVTKRLTPEFSYADVLAGVLLRKRDTVRFPTDSEFIERLTTRDVYRMKSGLRSFLFERLENAGNKEVVDVDKGLANKKLSIEHIMPQTLSRQWRDDLGEAAPEIHSRLLHVLGNLTLTGYNSEMQNISFAQKREFYRDSPIWLTREVAKEKVWDADQIDARTDALARRLAHVMALPVTTYQEPEPERESELDAFDSERDYTGMKLVGYEFQGNGFVGETVWKNMLVGVVKLLYLQYPDQINTLALQDGAVLYNAFQSIKDDGYTRIVDGVYLWTSSSTSDKMKLIRHLFELLDIEADDLEMQLA